MRNTGEQRGRERQTRRLSGGLTLQTGCGGVQERAQPDTRFPGTVSAGLRPGWVLVQVAVDLFYEEHGSTERERETQPWVGGGRGPVTPAGGPLSGQGDPEQGGGWGQCMQTRVWFWGAQDRGVVLRRPHTQ